MIEAKAEITRILTMIHHLEIKERHLMTEMDLQYDQAAVATKYEEIVRINAKILNDILTLQDQETCLRRPFVFKQVVYDYEYLSKQLKHLRAKLLKQCRGLDSYGEMRLTVGEDGHVSELI